MNEETRENAIDFMVTNYVELNAAITEHLWPSFVRDAIIDGLARTPAYVVAEWLSDYMSDDDVGHDDITGIEVYPSDVVKDMIYELGEMGFLFELGIIMMR